jgi:hypothetical protein
MQNAVKRMTPYFGIRRGWVNPIARIQVGTTRLRRTDDENKTMIVLPD